MKFIKILFCLLLILPISGCYVVSDGNRTGIVSKFSKKGILVKTWEGELILGGYGSSAHNVWQFSVEKEEIAIKIIDAQNNNKIVTLSYKEEFYVAPWRGDTNYFIQEVKMGD